MFNNILNTLNKELLKQGIFEYIDQEEHFVIFMEHAKVQEVNDDEPIECKEMNFYYIAKGKFEKITNTFTDVKAKLSNHDRQFDVDGQNKDDSDIVSKKIDKKKKLKY